MSIIRLLGGVTRADLETAVKKAVTAALSDARPPEYDEVLSLAQQSASSARSAAQDADSAAHNATVAVQAVDSMNESLASHALTLAEIETRHDKTRADLRALATRVAALEGTPPEPEPQPPGPQPPPEPPNDDTTPPVPPVIIEPGRDWTLAATTPPTITGADATHAEAALWYAQNPDKHLDRSVADLAQRDDAYEYRHLRDRIQNVLLAFRRTKNLHLLDAVTTWLALCRQHLRVGYRDHDPNVVTWPASPYRMWPSKSGMPPNLRGTDLQVMNELKWATTIAEVAYALHLNRDRASPAGLDYGAEADFWRQWLTVDLTEKWSGGGNSGWRADYRGVRRTPTYNNGSGGGPQRHGRNSQGEWPLAINGGDMHSSVTAMLLAHYMHLLTGNHAARVERDWLAKNLTTVEMLQTPSPTGAARVIRQGWRTQGSTTNQSLRATYVGYVCGDLVTAHLENIPHITREVLTEFARAVRHFLWAPSVTTSDAAAILTRPDIIGGVTRAGIETHGSPRTQAQALNFNLLTIAPWDETGYLDSEANRLHSLSWSGGWTQPRTLAATAGRLIKAAA